MQKQILREKQNMSLLKNGQIISGNGFCLTYGFSATETLSGGDTLHTTDKNSAGGLIRLG